MMRQINMYAHFQGTRGMVYSDPLLDNVQSTKIPFVKYFRYMYRREQRIVWVPKFPIHLEPVFLNVQAGMQRHLVV